jgi:hypothetical protein
MSLDLDQVRLSRVRVAKRRDRVAKRRDRARRSGARGKGGRDGLGSPALFRIRFIILAGNYINR